MGSFQSGRCMWCVWNEMNFCERGKMTSTCFWDHPKSNMKDVNQQFLSEARLKNR